jgi:hypothetical protein
VKDRTGVGSDTERFSEIREDEHDCSGY